MVRTCRLKVFYRYMMTCHAMGHGCREKGICPQSVKPLGDFLPHTNSINIIQGPKALDDDVCCD